MRLYKPSWLNLPLGAMFRDRSGMIGVKVSRNAVAYACPGATLETIADIASGAADLLIALAEGDDDDRQYPPDDLPIVDDPE